LTLPEYFEFAGDRGYFRPVKILSLDAAANLINEGLAFAQQQGLRSILVNSQALYGFDPPSILARYFFCLKWADTVGGAVRFAMVARPEMIDPNRFGVIVARTRGAVADVFASEVEAEAWLDSGME
jgi:hypothetical protein